MTYGAAGGCKRPRVVWLPKEKILMVDRETAG